MFKKFDDACVSGTTQLKSSVQKGIRNKIVEQFPNLENYIEEIMPKKDSVKVVKCQNHVELLINDPFICPLMQVDAGAIQFVLQGANVMCPGLTSRGAIMTPDLPVGSVVTVIADGKDHALAVGVLKMSSGDIGRINKGIAIESVHYLNDGLWRLKPIR